MGNEPLCGQDTRSEYNQGHYMVCGYEPDFRNSTTINIVNHVPVVSGQPLNFQKQETFRKVEKSAVEFCNQNGLQNSFVPIVARIIAYGHTNIFKAYRRLPESSKYDFLDQLRFLDIDFIDLLYHRYVVGKRPPKAITQSPSKLINTQEIALSKRNEYENVGRQSLKNQEIGFMILCAGSSSRFMFKDKFLTPLELNEGQTLLEILIIRIMRLFESPSKVTPIILACNPQNKDLIEDFLKERKYFGINSSRIKYIQVPLMPIMDPKGKLCMTFQFKVIEKPSGTLKCVEQFLGSGIFQYLKSQGVSYLHILGAENLAEIPGDPFFLGYLIQNKLEIVGKCTDPIYETEDFQRYAGTKNGKTLLVATNQILQAKIPSQKLHKLVGDCPIAMNSVACKLEDLKSMIKNYDNSMFLSRQYEPIKKTQTYYDFDKEKPVVNQPVIVFQKDLGHLFTCSSKHQLLKVPRTEFVPILNRSGSYSTKQACRTFLDCQSPGVRGSKVSEY